MSMIALKVSAALVLSAAAMLGLASPDDEASGGPPALDAAQVTSAEADYQKYCALCHAPDRTGYANDHAPSLTSHSLLSSGFPYALYAAIAYGRGGTAMGGYLDEVGGPLTEAEVQRMVMWLVEAAGEPQVMMAFKPVAGSPASGADIYANHCVACHGVKGEGGTGTAVGNAAMLSLTPDSFLRHAIANGREGTPMPAWGARLGAQEIDDVTAYLRSLATDAATPRGRLRTPPPLSDAVLNPEGEAPTFAFKGDHYILAADLDRVLREKRRLVLLDTRVPSMWQMAHIEGAIPIPYYSARNTVIGSLPRDGTWIIAYCECPRAAADSVHAKLREAGFTHTAVLWEGIGGWVSLGYPVTTGRIEVQE